MLKIRRPLGRLIFNMGIAIPGKTVFLIETAPWCGVPFACHWVQPSIHWADWRLTARSHEVPKPRYSDLDFLTFLTALKFDRHLGSSVAEMPVKFQSDTIIITSNLAGSRLQIGADSGQQSDYAEVFSLPVCHCIWIDIQRSLNHPGGVTWYMRQ